MKFQLLVLSGCPIAALAIALGLKKVPIFKFKWRKKFYYLLKENIKL